MIWSTIYTRSLIHCGYWLDWITYMDKYEDHYAISQCCYVVKQQESSMNHNFRIWSETNVFTTESGNVEKIVTDLLFIQSLTFICRDQQHFYWFHYRESINLFWFMHRENAAQCQFVEIYFIISLSLFATEWCITRMLSGGPVN